MFKHSNTKAFWALVLILVSAPIPPAIGGYKMTNKDIYHKAWELVRDIYYDPTFNGQNWDTWEHRFDAEILSVNDAYRDIKIMLESLKDPYTHLLEPQSFKDMDERIVGTGISLDKVNGHLVVIETIENSPARSAGIQPKDQIETIDGSNIANFSSKQAMEKILGKAGSKVQISVKRGTKQLSFNVIRAEIEPVAVSYLIKQHNIGYIKVATFNSNNSARQFKTALENLSTAKGLIIDLRDNPGGLLGNALESVDMLLDGGVIVSTVGRNGRSVDTASGNPITHQPVVVLANSGSSGTAEIMIAALKENKRAIVIGTRTHGNGLTEEINHLPGGAAIHVSVSRWQSPSGRYINKSGVEPDRIVNDRTQQEEEAIEYLIKKASTSKS